jgi:hypothetical protein
MQPDRSESLAGQVLQEKAFKLMMETSTQTARDLPFWQPASQVRPGVYSPVFLGHKELDSTGNLSWDSILRLPPRLMTGDVQDPQCGVALSSPLALDVNDQLESNSSRDGPLVVLLL